MKVLFLCLGNICRSPLAEGAFRHLAASRGRDDIEIASAGTGGWHAGEPPDERSVRIARENGVDISAQRARQLTADDYARFDWIVAMDADNLRTAEARRPRGDRFQRARTAALIDFAEAAHRDAHRGVPDPYYGDLEGFREVWRILVGAMPRLFEHVHSVALEVGR